MLARDGTSEGVNWWLRPWRARKAIGTGGCDGPLGEGCSAMVMGAEVVPQGVVSLSAATGVKPGRLSRPVPPMTPILTGWEYVEGR